MCQNGFCLSLSFKTLLSGIILLYIAARPQINIVTISCGEHMSLQISPWLFSIIRTTNFSASDVCVTIIADEYGERFLQPCLAKIRRVVDLTLISVRSLSRYDPIDDNNGKFRCAFFKLYLSEIMHNMSKVLYLDLDLIIQRDINELWKYFEYYPSKLLFAVAEVNVTGIGSWYETHTHYKKHFFPPTGINSGVLLMNLAEMRALNVTGEYIQRSNTEKVMLPDQDILNSWAFFNKKLVHVLPCEWNKRTDNLCPNVTHWLQEFHRPTGIVHGNRNLFSKKHFWYIPEHDRIEYNVFCMNKTK